jgi:colanic acid/amylovoran biosynthesis glycosyltransferase
VKRILLFTSHYPYMKGEDFLESELRYLPEGVAVRIVPLNAVGRLEPTRVLPEGVACEPLYERRYGKISKGCDVVRAMLRPTFWDEVAYLVKTRHAMRSCLKSLLVYMAAGERAVGAVRRKYAAELAVAGPEGVAYSFWMIKGAYAAARLKEIYGCRAISRAHGADLYESRETKPYQPLRRWLLRTLDGVRPVSEAGRAHLVERYGFADKVRVAHLGTRDYGVRTLVGVTGEVFTVVSVSNLIPLKRVPLLLDGLGRIEDRPVRWVHFGEGEERDRLERAKATLPPNVDMELRGQVTHEALVAFFQETDVHLFVNLSVTEGIPVSIMEAMSFGVPVLATDVGGTCELVKDGVEGRLLPKDVDARRVEAGIRSFLDMERTAYDEYRVRARAAWEKGFSAAKNYPAFYRDLTEEMRHDA